MTTPPPPPARRRRLSPWILVAIVFALLAIWYLVNFMSARGAS